MVGNQIRELRRRDSMTQAQLAKCLGVSTGAVGLWETDKREPDISTILKMAKIFEVSTDYLLGNKIANCIVVSRNGKIRQHELSDENLLAVENMAKSLSEKK